MKPPFVTKVCPVCRVEKPRSGYYKKGNNVSHKCKPCSLADSRSRAHKYFGKYAEYANNWRRERYKTSEEFRNTVASQRKTRYERLKTELNEARRERWRTDPFCPAKLHYRRKDVKGRTPKWADKKALLAIYAACPKGMHVDHIIPLKGLIDGRPVTGLHVPYNLQYLTPEQNQKKHNRISEEDISR